MRWGQILSLIEKRVFRFGSQACSTPAARPRGSGVATAFLRPDVRQRLEDGVTFLNHLQPFQSGLVDWRNTRLPKLWRYNLHYFNYLLWPAVSVERKTALLESWIESNPSGTEDAWEPYTVSLRVVNWTKYFSLLDTADSLSQRWCESLALQVAWLEKNLETHILANHYWKNIKALIFAGVFFEGAAAKRWLERGSEKLSEQVREQFLPSGAHYELSTMYHCACVEDLLDVLNVIRANPDLFSEGLASLVETTARRSLDFLSAILLPDGQIPLFNDAAFGIEAEPSELFGYADRLFDYSRPEEAAVSFPDAGYFVLGHQDNRMIIDCGPVSPAYQPGHTHCDMLSYELALAGRRVVIDTGVYDYENSVERRYCRSTRAHNTVCVDGQEQSELWGVFRVARRASVIHAERILGNDGVARFVGEIKGFPLVAGSIRHRRVVDYDLAGRWRVIDEVFGHGVHRVDSYIHLHPGLSARALEKGVVVEDSDGTQIACIRPEKAVELRVEEGWYFPEFGMKRRNIVLRLSIEARLPVTMGYCIEKA